MNIWDSSLKIFSFSDEILFFKNYPYVLKFKKNNLPIGQYSFTKGVYESAKHLIFICTYLLNFSPALKALSIGAPISK